jgi:hypothetical protein
MMQRKPVAGIIKTGKDYPKFKLLPDPPAATFGPPIVSPKSDREDKFIS